MHSTNTSRTAHLLELMKKGDDAFNSRDVAAMNAAHHPDITLTSCGPYDKERERFSYGLSLPLLRIKQEHRPALFLLYSFLARIHI